MARFPRVVAPGLPHHITQRGNRRQPTFFEDSDYEAHLDLMADWYARVGVALWAYCLMLNHVHLVAVSGSEKGLARAIREAHRRYTRGVNLWEGWRVGRGSPRGIGRGGSGGLASSWADGSSAGERGFRGGIGEGIGSRATAEEAGSAEAWGG